MTEDFVWGMHAQGIRNILLWGCEMAGVTEPETTSVGLMNFARQNKQRILDMTAPTIAKVKVSHALLKYGL